MMHALFEVQLSQLIPVCFRRTEERVERQSIFSPKNPVTGSSLIVFIVNIPFS